jgi:D-ribose pyranase
VTEGIPRFLDVVEAVANDFEFEEVIIANETKKISPEVHAKLIEIVGKHNNKGNEIKITYIEHPDFKDAVLHGAERGDPIACFVKTGEFTPFANIMFVSGVPF